MKTLSIQSTLFGDPNSLFFFFEFDSRLLVHSQFKSDLVDSFFDFVLVCWFNNRICLQWLVKEMTLCNRLVFD